MGRAEVILAALLAVALVRAVKLVGKEAEKREGGGAGVGEEGSGKRECWVGVVGPCKAGPRLVSTEMIACTRTYFRPKPGENSSVFQGLLKFDGCGYEYEHSDCHNKISSKKNFQDNEIAEESSFDVDDGSFKKALNIIAVSEDTVYACAEPKIQANVVDQTWYETVTCICDARKPRCNAVQPTKENTIMWKGKLTSSEFNYLVPESYIPQMDYGPMDTAVGWKDAPCPLRLHLDPLKCRVPDADVSFIEVALARRLNQTDCTGAQWCLRLEGNISAIFGGVKYTYSLNFQACDRLLDDPATPWAFLEPANAQSLIKEPCDGLAPGAEKRLDIDYAAVGTELSLEAKGSEGGVGTRLGFKAVGNISLACKSTQEPTTKPTTESTTETTTEQATTPTQEPTEAFGARGAVNATENGDQGPSQDNGSTVANQEGYDCWYCGVRYGFLIPMGVITCALLGIVILKCDQWVPTLSKEMDDEPKKVYVTQKQNRALLTHWVMKPRPDGPTEEQINEYYCDEMFHEEALKLLRADKDYNLCQWKTSKESESLPKRWFGDKPYIPFGEAKMRVVHDRILWVLQDSPEDGTTFGVNPSVCFPRDPRRPSTLHTSATTQRSEMEEEMKKLMRECRKAKGGAVTGNKDGGAEKVNQGKDGPAVTGSKDGGTDKVNQGKDGLAVTGNKNGGADKVNQGKDGPAVTGNKDGGADKVNQGKDGPAVTGNKDSGADKVNQGKDGAAVTGNKDSGADKVNQGKDGPAVTGNKDGGADKVNQGKDGPAVNT